MIDADLVVVGVGVKPVTDWLEGSGLTISDGVVCDETCLAAPGVVAAGDVARWPNPLFDGESMRLEHWTNATEQGVAAAERLLVGDGDAQPFAPVPFVWSDQYDVKIQCVGRFQTQDESLPSRTARSPSGASSPCSVRANGSSVRSGSAVPARSCSIGA